jgi:hypothetical protein
MFLANKQDRRSNVFSCDRYGVFAAHGTMSIFAETFAHATSLRAISEISSFSQPWRVTAARRLFAT